MHLVSKRPFNEAVKAHPNQRQDLEDLYRVLRKSEFGTSEAMRRVFQSLDNFKHKDKWWVRELTHDAASTRHGRLTRDRLKIHGISSIVRRTQSE